MKPKVYTSKDHHIRNHLIDPDALHVLEKLKDAGYEAYLVGGGVRDLLLHAKPKDFDISTSAKPSEIKALFRSCLLIGRRFRLAHVRFGKKVIEVSTFRAGDPTEDTLIQEDNLWGTPKQDVLRRDFTINGLFYDPTEHLIIDYVGGFEDLQNHLLRCIGDPMVRFRQDPVRMIRMEKFRARFDFHTTDENLEALAALKDEIKLASKARVLEEILRMLESGNAKAFFALLHGCGILKILLPHFDEKYMEAQATFDEIFAIIDDANQNQKLTRSVCLAFLLWPILDQQVKSYLQTNENSPHLGILFEMIQELIHKMLFEPFMHFPKKIRFSISFYLHSQYRLTPISAKKVRLGKVLQHKEIQGALKLLKLRSLLDHELFKPYTKIKSLLNKEVIKK